MFTIERVNVHAYIMFADNILNIDQCNLIHTSITTTPRRVYTQETTSSWRREKKNATESHHTGNAPAKKASRAHKTLYSTWLMTINKSTYFSFFVSSFYSKRLVWEFLHTDNDIIMKLNANRRRQPKHDDNSTKAPLLLLCVCRWINKTN